MGTLGFLCAVIACGLIVVLTEKWDKRKEEKEQQRLAALKHDVAGQQDAPNEKKNDMENNMGTRDLFMQTLTKIGCQYELAEEEGDNRIFFAYQGEHFFADTTNEGWYVHVWDTHWYHVELYDVDELSRLKKAINNANLNCATITVYTIDEAGSNVDVHCKSTFPFIPQIPNIETYLRGELNDFFRAHQYVGSEMTKLREQEANS